MCERGVGLVVVVELEVTQTHQVFIGYVKNLEVEVLVSIALVEAEGNLVGGLAVLLWVVATEASSCDKTVAPHKNLSHLP